MLRNAPSQVSTFSPCPSPSLTLQPLQASVCSLRDRGFDPYSVGQNSTSRASSVVGDDEAGLDDIVLQPVPFALTHTLTHYDPAPSSPLEEEFSTPRQYSSNHQRSLTGSFLDKCSPLVQRATSSLQQQTSKISLTSSRRSIASFISAPASSPTKTRSSRALGDWFTGASAPINVGFLHTQLRNFDPTDDEAEEEDEYERHNSHHDMFTQSQKGSREAPQRPASTASKFSWILGGGSSTPKNSKPKEEDVGSDTADELLNLNIDKALLPNGQADAATNPTAFNDLLAAAESLLERYQAAYCQQAILITELRAEQSAQTDELDGAETRARHLKLQLDDMSAKAAEQDRALLKLKRELENERELRRQEEEAHLYTMQMASEHSHSDNTISRPVSPTSIHQSSKRLSTTRSIDSGFESGDESYASSMLSRNTSRNASPILRSSETMGGGQAYGDGGLRPTLTVNTKPLTGKKNRWSGITITEASAKASAANKDDGVGPWQVVSKMREENAHLRVRVRELESAVEDSLEMMIGLGLKV